MNNTNLDYFAKEALLKQKVSAAESVPWLAKPSREAIEARMRELGTTFQRAAEELEAELKDDARRLDSVAPDYSEKIRAAITEAEVARSHAENLLAEHQATLAGITASIFKVGHIRRRIRAAQLLKIGDDEAASLATSALHYFCERQLGADSLEILSGFQTSVQDLVYRTALSGHVNDFIQPLEQQAKDLIAEIQSEALSAKIDLKKVMELLASERGQRGGDSLQYDPSLYSGLV